MNSVGEIILTEMKLLLENYSNGNSKALAQEETSKTNSTAQSVPNPPVDLHAYNHFTTNKPLQGSYLFKGYLFLANSAGQPHRSKTKEIPGPYLILCEQFITDGLHTDHRLHVIDETIALQEEFFFFLGRGIH